MFDLQNIKNYTIQRPEGWTLFGHAGMFDALPDVHQQQVFFLAQEAGKYLYDFLDAAHIITGEGRDPFAKGNFKIVERIDDFSETEESRHHLKKWLYQRGIPFSTKVYVLPGFNDHPFITTWKMVVRYAPELLCDDDIVIFDATLNWCLYFYHENYLSFGKYNIYDATDELKKMEEFYEKRKQYPQLRPPFG